MISHILAVFPRVIVIPFGAILMIAPTAATITPDTPLLLSDAKLAHIHKLEAEDPLMRDLLVEIRKAAQTNQNLPPNTHLSEMKPGTRDMLGQSRAAASRIIASAFAYRLDADPRHLETARRDLLNVCRFPDWDPAHFLDTAEMGFGVALGYTWLRHDLPAEDAATIRTALYQNLLRHAPAAYNREGRGSLKWKAFGNGDTATNNWNFVCNAGFVAAALSLKNEHPQLAALVFAGARDSLPKAMVNYAPDGAWPEGPTYWSYGTTYLVNTLAILEEASENISWISNQPGFDHTLFYALQVFGPSGLAFNFADSNPRLDHSMPVSTYTWLSKHFNHPQILPEARRLLSTRVHSATPENTTAMRRGLSGRPLVFNALFFPEKTTHPSPALPLDAHFRGKADFAVLRSHASDANALWIAVKGGRNDVPHSHLDLGSFVLDAGGVRWALDLGQESYRLPKYFDYREGGQRWKYYRLNNHSHNTLTLGNRLQSPTANAPITHFENSPQNALITVDLTNAYPKVSSKILRHVSMPGRTAILIEDEIKGLLAGESLTWRMLTPAKITLSADARTAILAQDGKRLRAILSGPDEIKFNTSPARPLTKEEIQNDGITVLSATVIPDSPDVRLAVRFELNPESEN